MTNKKTKIGRIAKFLAFCFVFVLLMQAWSMIFIPKSGNNNSAWTSYITKAYIGERKDSIDVLLIGNSNLYRGFSPIDCWLKYGIASCDSGKPWQSPRGAYDVIRDSMIFQDPKIVVLETDMFFSAHKVDVKKAVINKGKTLESKIDEGFDNFDEKLGAKVDYYFPRVIKSGFTENILKLDAGLETSISYYFPLIRYHDRWNKLTRIDFLNLKANYRFTGKGFISSVKRKPYRGRPDYMSVHPDKPLEMSDTASEYLNRIVDLCRKNHITLVLLSIPSPNSWSDPKHDAVMKFAAQNDLKFVDFNKQAADLRINWRKDFLDGGTHLNLYGARKVTNHFGKYLKENFELPDHRGEPAYDSWFMDSKVYLK